MCLVLIHLVGIKSKVFTGARRTHNFTVAWIHVLLAFVFLQIIIILLQDYLGSAFFLPRSVRYSAFLMFYAEQTIPTVQTRAKIRLSSVHSSPGHGITRTISRRLCNLHGCDHCATDCGLAPTIYIGIDIRL